MFLEFYVCVCVRLEKPSGCVCSTFLSAYNDNDDDNGDNDDGGAVMVMPTITKFVVTHFTLRTSRNHQREAKVFL